jgi:hypothetical protein
MSTAQNPWPPIGEMFVEQGILTSAQLEHALAEQRETGGRLGEILVERGYISRIHLAGALSKQWSFRHDAQGSTESPAAPIPSPEESVESEPVAAAIEWVPLPALPASEPPPAPPVEQRVEFTMSPLRIDTVAAPVAAVSGLEDQERLLRDLQARLRETHEQLAAGAARLGPLEAKLAELSQAHGTLNARLDAQTREIEDLRRVTADQAMRLAAAASALLG